MTQGDAADPTLHGLAIQIAIIKEELKAIANALIIKNEELERRLADLNHAHSRASEVLANYMPRELADRNWREMADWKVKWEVAHQQVVTREELEKALQGVDSKLALLTEYRQNIMGRFGALSDAWGWLIGIAGVVIAFVTFWFSGVAPNDISNFA